MVINKKASKMLKVFILQITFFSLKFVGVVFVGILFLVSIISSKIITESSIMFLGHPPFSQLHDCK